MNQNQPIDNQELSKQVLAMGTQALDMLRGFGLDQISGEELVDRLPQLGAQAILAQHWVELSRQPAYAACFEVLHFLSSLESEIGYQLLRYGPTSIYEDFKELELAVMHLKKTLQP